MWHSFICISSFSSHFLHTGLLLITCPPAADKGCDLFTVSLACRAGGYKESHESGTLDKTAVTSRRCKLSCAERRGFEGRIRISQRWDHHLLPLHFQLSSLFVGQQLQWKNEVGARSQLTRDTGKPCFHQTSHTEGQIYYVEHDSLLIFLNNNININRIKTDFCNLESKTMNQYCHWESSHICQWLQQMCSKGNSFI